MNKYTICNSETPQLQELIDFFRSKLLLTCNHYTADAYIQFLKDMLYALEASRQFSASQCYSSVSADNEENYWRWVITFQLFPAIFHYTESILWHLLQSANTLDTTLKAKNQPIGKTYRTLAEQIKISPECTPTFDLLDALKSRLIRQQSTYSEYGNIALTTYHNQSFISTYGFAVELINPKLLFIVIKDIGELFAKLFSKPQIWPEKLAPNGRRQSLVW